MAENDRFSGLHRHDVPGGWVLDVPCETIADPDAGGGFYIVYRPIFVPDVSALEPEPAAKESAPPAGLVTDVDVAMGVMALASNGQHVHPDVMRFVLTEFAARAGGNR